MLLSESHEEAIPDMKTNMWSIDQIQSKQLPWACSFRGLWSTNAYEWVMHQSVGSPKVMMYESYVARGQPGISLWQDMDLHCLHFRYMMRPFQNWAESRFSSPLIAIHQSSSNVWSLAVLLWLICPKHHNCTRSLYWSRPDCCTLSCSSQ